jgi:hypothetical protein
MAEYEQSVFISYAWGGESEAIVNQIDAALQGRGLKIIRDKRDLGYKGSISAFMERIGEGNCVIVIISDKYLRSPNCMFELVEIAEGKQFHDRVFPIVLSNAEIYDPVKRLEYVKHWEIKRAELAQAMKEVDPANLQGIREDMDLYDRIRDKVSGLTSILKDMNTLTPDMHRDSDFSEIYTGIERRMAEASGQFKPETGKSPYMGLRYFDTSDADLFYGREALTHELLARVQKESFLAIVGASGSGKSSVARAGLIPAWKQEHERGAIHVITPTVHPLENLAASLTRTSESVTATSTLMDDMQNDARSLRLYVKKMLSASGETNLLLVVDQFEETFTLCKDLSERKAFIENLLSLAEEDNNAARVVITLRADFYHHCFDYEGLRLTLEKHQANLGAMTQDELREAILKPAETNGWDFQPGLVDLILQDVGTEPGALPLLSHALLETWKRRQGRALTLQGYAEAGGVKKAIAQTAEGVYDKLSPSEQTIARNIFLRLTELGEGTQDTRRRVKMDELAQAKEQDAVAKVLKTLTDARLVTTEQDSAEVAHEALIREWGTLRKWLDEDRENLSLYRHMQKSAEEWERHGREASELYRGARLKQLQDWGKEHDDAFSPLEKEFVKASQKAKKRERMGWVAIAGTGAMLLIGIILLIINWIGSESTANTMLENRLSSAADSVMYSVPFFFETGQNLATQLASDPRLLDGTEDEIKSIIGSRIQSVPYFDQILVMDAKNQNLIVGYPNSPVEDFRLFPDEITGITLASNGVLTQFYSIPPRTTGDSARVSFLVAIVDSSGQVQRVLIGRTSLSTNPLLTPIINTINKMREEGGTGFLLNENNLIMYCSSCSQVFTAYDGHTSNRPFFTDYTNVNCTNVMVYYHPSIGIPWAIVLESPQVNSFNMKRLFLRNTYSCLD